MLRLRRDDLQAFHRAQHRDCGRDDTVAVEQSGADQAERDDDFAAQGVGVASLLLQNERKQGEDSALAIVVRAHNEDDVLDADDDDQRPDDERENAIDIGRNRRQSMLCLEALSERIKRTGADVAIDDAQREECEFCETAAARTSFVVSTDLRDL